MDTFILPLEIIAITSAFSGQFTKPTWNNIKLMLTGAILCRGPRRICSILRVMGLSHMSGFCRYHRLFSRAKWNSLQLSKILLGLLIALLPKDHPIVIVADETIEQRRGKKIKAKGCYRDPVRSSRTTAVTCFGLSWQCMALIVALPFCQRPWALPFLTVLAPSKQAHQAVGKPHKTSIDWTIVMVKLVCRWLGTGLRWILVGDGAYACFNLAKTCQHNKVTQISRLRLDAQLYNFAQPVPAGKPGRRPIKGDRIQLKGNIDDESENWQLTKVLWYGQKPRMVKILSKSCLWYQAGKGVIALRYVLVVDPEGKHKPEAFYSTDIALAPEKIIEYYVLRWNIEVTFAESRSHLGFGTQRQWADRSIARTTPMLIGLYSLVTLFALELRKARKLAPDSTVWYDKKDNVTFSDAIALVKRVLWSERYLSKSAKSADIVKIRQTDMDALINQLAAA